LNILPETYARLAKHPNINSIKEAKRQPAAVIKTRDLCGDEIYIYSGEDTVIVPMLSVGCMGVISVLSNVCPKENTRHVRALACGKTEDSAKLQIKYSDLVAGAVCEVSPIPSRQRSNTWVTRPAAAGCRFARSAKAAKKLILRHAKGRPVGRFLTGDVYKRNDGSFSSAASTGEWVRW
jgi:hypothetical protein